MPRKKPLTKSARREEAARCWSSAVLGVAALGLILAVLGPWGGRAWFALDISDEPLAGWLAFSWMPVGVFGALVIWSVVVWFLASAYRPGDRHAWVWGWGGLAIVALISLSAAYAASRNGVALFEDRIVWRQAVLAPLEVTPDAEVASLNVRCEMVRRSRSIRPNDLIDRPMWTLTLRDGRVIEIGGVRGAGLGHQSQAEWLIAMRRLSRYPVHAGALDPRCVQAVTARFPERDQPFVGSLFGPQAMANSSRP